MPFGDNDWLALTQEPTLEPELPICDTHHHFWDLRPRSIPYQRYLIHELNADIYSGHNVRSTVFVEANSMYRPDGPVESRPVGEVEFVQGLAAASASGIYGPSRAAAAIIGHADLKLAGKVEPVLEALQASGESETLRSKIVVLSALTEPHLVEELAKLGAHLTMTKPLHISELIALVEEAAPTATPSRVAA